MKSRRVVLAILPDRIDLLPVGGSGAGGVRVEHDAPSDAGHWITRLGDRRKDLARAVDQLGVAGADAHVLYRSPSTVVELQSLRMRSAAAVDAARLACLDGLPYSLMGAVSAGAVVGRDASAGHTHVVTAIDREDVLGSIANLAGEAGLKFSGAVPTDAVILAHRLRDAIRHGEESRAVLWVGEHSAFFLVVQAGDLLFHRRIDLGLETLASSLTRPTLGDDDESVELSADAARILLRDHGIPHPDEIVDARLGLTGSQVRPLLQPVLQRFVVELRQSLRFGIEEDQRRTLSVELTGPGAALPHLAALLTEELRIGVRPDREVASLGQWADLTATDGDVPEIMRHPAWQRRFTLRSHDAARRDQVRRLRRRMWAGAAVALVAIGIDAFRIEDRAARIRATSDLYAMQQANVGELKRLGDELLAVHSAHIRLERTVREQAGQRVDAPAALKEITLLTPENVRYTTIRLDREGDKVIARLSGCAFADDESQSDPIELLLERLRSSVLFDHIRLGTVHVGAIDGRPGRRFDVSLHVLPVQHDLGLPPIALSEEAS